MTPLFHVSLTVKHVEMMIIKYFFLHSPFFIFPTVKFPVINLVNLYSLQFYTFIIIILFPPV
jgi:hypothetical protein